MVSVSGETLSRPSRTGRRRPAALGDLSLLVAGLGFSTAGDAAALVALLLRLRPDGSGWVAALLAAQMVPRALLSSVIGRVVDRFETRRVLLLALVGQTHLAVLLAFAGPPSAILAVFAGLATLNALVRPATSALLPVITGTDKANHGYSWLATGYGLGLIAGSAAGGILTSVVGTRATLLSNAATFAVLTLACSALRTRRHPSQDAGGQAAGRRAGFALLRTDRVLRLAVAISAIAIACAVVDNVAAPFRFINQLGAGSGGYGTYMALWAASALLGSQVPRRIGPDRQQHAVGWGNLLAGLGIIGIGLAPNFLAALIAAVVGGVGNGLANVAQNTLISHRTPAASRGQTFAATGAVFQAAIGIGTAAGAALVKLLEANGAFIGSGTVTAAFALTALIIIFRLGREKPPDPSCPPGQALAGDRRAGGQ